MKQSFIIYEEIYTLTKIPAPRRSPKSPHECSEEDLQAQAVKAPKKKLPNLSKEEYYLKFEYYFHTNT
jgi:hypothetical protein